MGESIPAMWMRGGTSKALYLLQTDISSDAAVRDRLLLRIMGSPDSRQIDGLGGADPLTSKIAIISASDDPKADIDYLFLQVAVDKAEVSDSQGCGNILAGVGPFAIERGLVKAENPVTTVRIRMLNTGEYAEAEILTPNRKVAFAGDESLDGVPGTAAAIPLFFSNLAGSICGSLLPTGHATDTLNGIECSLIDNGMPCVIMRAADFGLTGNETREALAADQTLKNAIESIRLQAGKLMGLGNVGKKSVPKMTLITASSGNAVVNTISFIPHHIHASIGVFAAISVATACVIPHTVAAPIARLPDDSNYIIEHPSGTINVRLEMQADGTIQKSGIIRTARKLMDGSVFV
jgi:4-oxalomesaconate tautomerase